MQPRWTADLWLRCSHRPALKALGITAFMWMFFAAYFHLLRHPARPVLVMPLTALDRAIPFQPNALLAYVSLWLYVGVPVGLMLRVREAVAYGAWASGLCLAGLGCFYAWPTAVPAFEFGADAARHAGFALIQGLDAAGNACPSLHVAGATFTAFWIHRLLAAVGAPPWLRLANAGWWALIVWSTLAIKQHVVLDVLAGSMLALAFAWPSLRWSPPTRPAATAAARGRPAQRGR